MNQNDIEYIDKVFHNKMFDNAGNEKIYYKIKAIRDEIKEQYNLKPLKRWIKRAESGYTGDGITLYMRICPHCNGIAYFRKSMNTLICANYCPCCGESMNPEEE